MRHAAGRRRPHLHSVLTGSIPRRKGGRQEDARGGRGASEGAGKWARRGVGTQESCTGQADWAGSRKRRGGTSEGGRKRQGGPHEGAGE
jgi:hypothetical protein